MAFSNSSSMLKRIFCNIGVWRLALFFIVPCALSPILILFDTQSAKAGYILLIVSSFLVFEILPIAMTVLFSIFLMAITGTQSTAEAATAFATETFFLFASVLMLAISIEETTLHNRIALKVLRLIGVSKARLILGFILISGVLSMWMSNTAVTLMTLPIAMAVSESLNPSTEEVEPAKVPTAIPYKERIQRISVCIANSRKNSMQVEAPIFRKTSMSSNSHLNVNGARKQSTVRFAADYITNQLEMPVRIARETEAELEAFLEEAQVSVGEGLIRSLKEDKEKEERLKLSKALQLATAYGANIGGMSTLIGAYPNLIMKINVEKLYGMDTGLNFLTFLMVAAPITFGGLLLTWTILSIMFIPGWLTSFWKKGDNVTETKTRRILDEKHRLLGPLRQSELTVIIVFLTVIVLWLTRDPRVVRGWGSLLPHGCATDSLPALGGAVLLFALPISFADMAEGHYAPILSWKRVASKFPWELLLFAGGLTTLTKLADKSGLITLLGRRVPDLSGYPPVAVAAGICLVASTLTEFMSNSFLTAVAMPILATIAEDLRVNPLYFMLAATIAAQFSFMVPISSFPTVIVKASGTVTMGDLARAGLGPKIVCLLLLIFSLEGLGSMVYDIHTFPDWAEQRRMSRYLTPANETFASDTLSLSNVIRGELESSDIFANLSALFNNESYTIRPFAL